MADRLVLETERLRTTIRAGALTKAVPILRRLMALVSARTGESSSPPRRRLTAHGTTWIPLTAFAHEVHRDRRTVRNRLEGTGLLEARNGVEVVHVEEARLLFPEGR